MLWVEVLRGLEKMGKARPGNNFPVSEKAFIRCFVGARRRRIRNRAFGAASATVVKPRLNVLVRPGYPQLRGLKYRALPQA